jgi:dTMP kinase
LGVRPYGTPMAFLLAIEGADGAGKATAAAATVEAFGRHGLSAAVVSFPRYTATVGGHALGEFLGGRLPVVTTPHAAAVLYALDRFESRGYVEEVAAACDVVVFDRYIASNIVYQAAKVSPGEAAAMTDWIVSLETAQFALPRPDLSIYLDTPLAVARTRIARKAQRSYTDRTFDENEADDALQRRVRDGYAALAAGPLLGAWRTVSTVKGDTSRLPAVIAEEIAATALPLLRR